MPDELVPRGAPISLPQTRASMLVAVLLAGIYGFIFVPSVGWFWYLLWYLTVAAGFLGRQVYSKWLLDRHGINQRNLFLIAVVSALIAWVSTLSIALFAPYLTSTEIGILTSIMVSTVMLPVSILVVPRVYLWHVVACFANVLAGWAWHAQPHELAFMTLNLVLGGILLVRLSYHVAGQLRETADVARKNAELIRQLQNALTSQQEAQRARSRFLGAASHDLRQPVQALLFLIDLFRTTDASNRNPELVGQIVRTAESIDAMFRHLVDYAQIDAGTLKAQLLPVDLPRLVQAATSGFAEKCEAKGLTFRLESVVPLTVLGDPVLLERLLRNILDNAGKYSREGCIELRSWREDSYARIEIRDQGVGMDQTDMEQAFKAFYRGRSAVAAEAEGIGLGLAVCKYLARQMHAKLWLDSQLNEGTTVSIQLPLAEPGVVATKQRTRGTPLDGLTAVVLEDDRLARDALCLWLRQCGAEVLQAASLEQLEPQLLGHPTTPDFVIADFRLANGNGLEAIAALRAEYGVIPAILLSGEGSIASTETDIPFLQKPVGPEHVLEHIEAMLPRGVSLSAARPIGPAPTPLP